MFQPPHLILLLSWIASIILLCIFGLNSYLLLWMSRHRERLRKEKTRIVEWPMVTIQIPVYNEGEVVRRTLESCLKLDYPRDRLEIIIVDDSTDETTKILREYEERYSPLIRVIHRCGREGYKAGALNVAAKNSRGEIFLSLIHI